MAPHPVSDPSSALSRPASSSSPPIPTSPSIADVSDRQESEFITLLITYPTSTFTTFILLGNPASSTQTLVAPTTYSVSSDTYPAINNDANPGLSAGTLAGIVVGCIGSFILLLGVGYVYLLRARQGKRFDKRFGGKRVKRKKKKRPRRRRDGDPGPDTGGGDASGGGGGGGGEAPAVEEAAPAPAAEG